MEELENKLRKADAVSRRLAGGGRPRRGAGHRRLVRTLLLGTLAVAASIYWLAVEYEVNMGELAGYLWASILFVALFAALAVAGAVALRAMKRLRSRSRSGKRTD